MVLMLMVFFHPDNGDFTVVGEHVKYWYSRPSDSELREWSEHFYEIADDRRSMRFFSRDPVPKDVIRTIIKTAGTLSFPLLMYIIIYYRVHSFSKYALRMDIPGTSPSGAHTQPWTFVAVSNAEMKQSIRTIVEYEEEINYKKRMGEEWTNDLKPLNTDWHKEDLTDAPWLILVFKQEYSVLPSGKRKTHYYKEVSVSIACGILISAIQVRTEFNLVDHHSIR